MEPSPRQNDSGRGLPAKVRRHKELILGMFHVITRYAFRPATPYANARFRFLQRLLFIACQDASYVEKFHLRINLWRDEDVKAWKESLIANCDSVAVAVSFAPFP